MSFSYTNGFLTGVSGLAGMTASIYASSIAYWPNLTVAQVVHGNGVTDALANDPNAMRRPLSIAATAGAATLWKTDGYAYDGAGDVTQIGAARFLYDPVTRLTSGSLVLSPQDTGTAVSQTYGYDAFGNLQSIGGTVARMTPTSSATNRLSGTGTTYDAAGNLTAWNGATYEYDPLNQLKHYVSGSEEWLYIYDADDERLWSYKPGVPGLSSRFDRWTLRDLAGKVLRTYEASGYNWTGSVAEDDVYRDGLLLAAELPNAVDTPHHFHLDHLGTPRLVTNRNGAQVAYHVYYPFGEEATAFNQDTERMKFTGHERDLASPAGAGDDLDYMHARHRGVITTRFLSVDSDPLHQAAKRPQRWNRYSYALSNPMKLFDPDGREAMVFIVAPSSAGDPKGLVGHSAIYVTSSKGSAGVSAYGDHGFQNKKGPGNFIRGYNSEGREVKMFVLKTTDSQDAKMVDFIKQHPEGGIDKSKSIAFENCTTACANVLKSGGVIGQRDDPGSNLSTLFFDSPKALDQSLTSGALSDRVTAVITFPAENPQDTSKIGATTCNGGPCEQ